jgi:uncharacterized membrane protein YcfT
VSSSSVDAALAATARDSSTAGVAGAREVWADVAKGVCILLVVLWHVVQKHYLEVTWRISAPVPGAWGRLGEQLLPLRMPLFFTVSGVFAARAVHRPWSVVGRSKVARFLYLFLLWVLIHTVLLSYAPDFETARARDGLELLEQLTVTPPNLWYLYALALYFVVAKVTRRAPPALVLGAAFALSAGSAAGLLATPGNRGALYENLFFFVAGLHLWTLVEGAARTATRRRVAVCGAAYAAALLAMAAMDAEEWPLVWPLTGIVAVGFGLTAAGRVARWRRLGGALAAIGRRTLPIYVIHMPVLALLDLMVFGPLCTADVRAQWVLAFVEPALFTGVIVAICLLLDGALRGMRLRWLFELPERGRPGRHRLDGARSPRRVPRQRIGAGRSVVTG